MESEENKSANSSVITKRSKSPSKSKRGGLFRKDNRNTKQLDMLNEIENQTAQNKLQDILANFEF